MNLKIDFLKHQGLSLYIKEEQLTQWSVSGQCATGSDGQGKRLQTKPLSCKETWCTWAAEPGLCVLGGEMENYLYNSVKPRGY